MSTFVPLPFTDFQQLEIGCEALAAYERGVVPMEADVYAGVARWMVEVLMRIDSPTLRRLCGKADNPLVALALNALDDRGEARYYWTLPARSAWDRLCADLGVRFTP